MAVDGGVLDEHGEDGEAIHMSSDRLRSVNVIPDPSCSLYMLTRS